MDPRPGLAILGRRHLLHVVIAQVFETVKRRPRLAAAPQHFQMLIVNAVPAWRHFKIFRQTFVEPEWDALEDAVEQSMRHLMAKILLDPVAPISVNEKIVVASHAR